MRHTFNEDSITVGYIKELLHNYELPKCDVFKDNESSYKGKVYVKGWHLARCTNKYKETPDSETSYYVCEWKNLDHFTPGHGYLNLTEKFEINSQEYDYETHVWLGRYLRFIRDYYGEDLMPLYNCFCNKSLHLSYPLTFYKTIAHNDDEKVTIDTSDSAYDYYYLPVKLNKEYTVALSCPANYDVECVFYDKRMITNVVTIWGDEKHTSVLENVSQTIARETHINTTSDFFSPYLFSTKVKEDFIDKYTPLESCLKMVIKMPHGTATSVVVLEGDFRDGVTMTSSRTPKPNLNKVAEPGEYGPLYFNNFNHTFENKTITRFGAKLSLLHYNNGISYPYADKLIPYLLGHTIDRLEDIDRNISRITDIIFPGISKFAEGIWTDKIRTAICDRYYNIFILYNTYSIKKSMIDFLNNSYDVLYYIDKDVEKLLSATTYVNWNDEV